MRINTNVSALNAQRTLGNTGAAVAKNMQKLSSGFRINKAADDAAGLGIANKLRADIRSLKQASRNAEQSTSMLQVAEGAAQTISSIVDRMKELATQAASDNVNAEGRTAIKGEWDALQSEIGRIVDTTKFQGGHLLKTVAAAAATNASSTSLAALDTANAGIASHTVGANATAGEYRLYQDGTDTDATLEFRATSGDAWSTVGTANTAAGGTITGNGLSIVLAADISTLSPVGSAHTFSVTGATAEVEASGGARNFLVSSSGSYDSQDLVALSAIDLTTGADGLNLSTLSFSADGGTAAEWQTALGRLDTAIDTINGELATIGAAQNRIEFATSNVKTTIENMSAAESTIRDADMAAEMTEFSKNQILQQAGISMLAQANSASQAVLKLLG